MAVYIWIAVVLIVMFLAGIRVIRPTHRGLVERLGRYNRFVKAGFQWVMPVVETLHSVNITEQMVDAAPQEIITFDNLNAASTPRSTSRSRTTRGASRPPSTTSITTSGRSSTWPGRLCATSSAR